MITIKLFYIVFIGTVKNFLPTDCHVSSNRNNTNFYYGDIVDVVFNSRYFSHKMEWKNFPRFFD